MNYNKYRIEREYKKMSRSPVSFFHSLENGIRITYFPTSQNREQIATIYRENYHIYSTQVHNLLIEMMKKHIPDYKTTIMYNNYVFLVLLFFKIDYENILRELGIISDDEDFRTFANHLFIKGSEKGLKNYFLLSPESIIVNDMKVEFSGFKNLALLGNQETTIVFEKFSKKMNSTSPPTIPPIPTIPTTSMNINSNMNIPTSAFFISTVEQQQFQQQYNNNLEDRLKELDAKCKSLEQRNTQLEEKLKIYESFLPLITQSIQNKPNNIGYF